MKEMLIIIFSVIVLFNNTHAETDVERFKLAVEFLKTAYISGEQVKNEGKADGGFSILKKCGSGSFQFSQTDVKGMVIT